MPGADDQAARLVGAGRRQHGATVEFRHVSKRFGPATTVAQGPNAVDDLSLTVAAGELCVLVGPSGCGKTTILRMVNRLVEPTTGQVLIDGRDVAREDPTALRRRIGYVIQQTGLFPHQTIEENVGTVPRLLGWPGERVRTRVDELLTLVGLEPARVRQRFPAELSGGERQRVGVARALAAEPPVLLMDEPFGAVDPIVRLHLQDELRRLHQTLGTTILFVTHDIDEAIKLGDRVAVLQVGGRLAQYAPPGDLLARPASDFVARFVGADRGLKHLALLTVADAPLEQVRTVRGDERTEAPAVDAGATHDHVLVLDAEGRPLRWLSPQPVSAANGESGGADAGPPLLVRLDDSLRDALSAVLTSPIERGVVVDDVGRYRSVLTAETVGAALRAATAPPPSSPPAPPPTGGGEGRGQP